MDLEVIQSFVLFSIDIVFLFSLVKEIFFNLLIYTLEAM